MAACAPQIFPSITDVQFACLTAKAAAQGIALAGDTGTASRDGVTLTWAYDSAAQTLTIQCTASPFFLSCDAINAQIQSLVAGCL